MDCSRWIPDDRLAPSSRIEAQSPADEISHLLIALCNGWGILSYLIRFGILESIDFGSFDHIHYFHDLNTDSC